MLYSNQDYKKASKEKLSDITLIMMITTITITIMKIEMSL